MHGLGGSWRSWATIIPALSETREVVAVDLPGHGETPAVADSGIFKGLADSVKTFIVEQGFDGIDIVGSSLGARIVLEIARRGKVGATIALPATSGGSICWEIGISRATANRRLQYGTAVIVWQLNGKRVPRQRSAALVIGGAK